MTSYNQIYEQNMRDKGLKKITLWIPDECADDLKLMAVICCENRDLIPSTVRSLTTGRMKGINSWKLNGQKNAIATIANVTPNMMWLKLMNMEEITITVKLGLVILVERKTNNAN